MKKLKLKNIFKLCLVASSLLLTACNNDENVPEDNPIFPESMELLCSEPGETGKLNFEANFPWTLSASKIWCKFILEEDTLTALQGLPGKYSVSVLLTQDSWQFLETKAEIKMGMLNQTQVIATLSRNAKTYTMKAWGETEQDTINDTHPIKLMWDKWQSGIEGFKLNLQANFEWQLSQWPAWVSLRYDDAVTGKIDELVLNECDFNNNEESYRDMQSGELVFTDKEGTERFKLPILYEGMPTNHIIFDIPAQLKYNCWFNQEGNAYWTQTIDGSPLEEISAPLQFEVIANVEQKLHPVYLQDDATTGLQVMSENDSWYTLTLPTAENNWMASIQTTPNETDSERKASVMMLPDVVFNNDELQGDLSNLLFEFEYDGKNRVKDTYQKYLVLAFTQEKPVEEVGFKLTDADGKEYPAELIPGVDETIFGTQNVFTCSFGEAMPSSAVRIQALAYSNSYPNISVNFNGQSTFWAGLETRFDGTDLIFNGFHNLPSSTTDSPMVITYMDGNGEIFSVLILQK